MRSSFYTPRESLIPKGAVKVSHKLSDAVAYLYACENHGQSHGKPALLVFYGQQAKPVARFYYTTEAKREAAIRRYFDIRRQHNAAKAEARVNRLSAVATVKFQVGKIYHDRSSCDWNTIYSFKIVARTEKQLTIEEHGKTYKRGVYVYNDVEHCKPHGTYSMCSVIRADREAV